MSASSSWYISWMESMSDETSGSCTPWNIFCEDCGDAAGSSWGGGGGIVVVVVVGSNDARGCGDDEDSMSNDRSAGKAETEKEDSSDKSLVIGGRWNAAPPSSVWVRVGAAGI